MKQCGKCWGSVLNVVKVHKGVVIVKYKFLHLHTNIKISAINANQNKHSFGICPCSKMSIEKCY